LRPYKSAEKLDVHLKVCPEVLEGHYKVLEEQQLYRNTLSFPELSGQAECSDSETKNLNQRVISLPPATTSRWNSRD